MDLLSTSSPYSERFFPRISWCLYSSVNSSTIEPSAMAILGLSNKEMSHWQLWNSKDLTEIEQLGRLLILHRKALANEVKDRWKRARIYWNEIFRTLEVMLKTKKLWDKLNGQYGFNYKPQLANTDSLQNRIITELFIDTNCALINSCLEKTESMEHDSRIKLYTGSIKKFLTMTMLYETENWDISQHFSDLLITPYQEENERDKAVKIWKKIGLSENTNDFSKSAIKLYKTLPILLETYSRDTTEIKAQLSIVTSDIPEINETNYEALEKYLEGVELETSLKSNIKETSELKYIPSLQIYKISYKEFVSAWYLNIEHAGLKTLTLVSLLALTTSTAMTGWDQYKRTNRNQAYDELQNAVKSGEDLLIMNAANNFLSSAAFLTDPRNEMVFSVYNKSFVSWFITVDDPNEIEVQENIKTYHGLMIDRGQRDQDNES